MGQGVNMERSAQQRAALLTAWLLTEGPLTVAQVAARLYETNSGAWKLLNEVGGVLPVVNDGGWWYVDLKSLADVRRIHDLTGAELSAAPPGTLYARPFKREEVERIHNMTGELLRVGTARDGSALPARKPDAATVEEASGESANRQAVDRSTV